MIKAFFLLQTMKFLYKKRCFTKNEVKIYKITKEYLYIMHEKRKVNKC